MVQWVRWVLEWADLEDPEDIWDLEDLEVIWVLEDL